MEHSGSAERISLSMELKITGTADSSAVAISVLELTHTNKRPHATAQLISLRHIPRAEWDADPRGCLRDELTLVIAPSLGVPYAPRAVSADA